VVEDAGAAGVGEELGAEADQAARRDPERHPDPAVPWVVHLGHDASPASELLGDHADVLVRAVHLHHLHRLVGDAGDVADDDLGLDTDSS